MSYINHLKDSLLKSKTVLDIWCGTWFFSILAASYGAKVIAIDEQSMTKKFKISPYMSDHPNITYQEWDLKNHNLFDKQTYDCIILRHVIMFLDAQYVLDILLPLLYNLLNSWWILYFTFFAEDDVIQNWWHQRISHCYSSDEIYTLFPNCEIIEEKIQDNENFHHIFHVFVRKS